MHVYLVRHAESVMNAADRVQGRHNPPLSPTGNQQARRLGDRLADQDLDAVYSSPLQRAYRTAEHIAEGQGIGVRLEPDLTALGYGEASGLPKEYVRHQITEASRSDDYWTPRGGEEKEAFLDRVQDAMGRITDSHEDDVCVVTHSAVARAFITLVENMPFTKAHTIPQDNACVNVYDAIDDRMVAVNGRHDDDDLPV